MTSESPLLDAALEDAREDRSLQDDLRLLAQDARDLAKAELAFQKSRAAYAGGEMRNIALLGIAAAVLLFFAVMALVVGLIIALTPLITAWGAMAVVTLSLLLLTGLCVFGAAGRWKRMAAIISAEDQN